ncbi:hypothetical protein ILUMI_07961 [Ignelater luminosus]|uniref:Uncharacterized protein n=1 Tax=Ignelater luminosus TaxID=2038154 RepID=A0A8K0GFV0_IGNLU|nr:hypothetical protein ILUMI_07961 [Ignelater luminosus]
MPCCSIANDLQHDPAALFVHLEPLMEEVKTLMPTIRHVSFLSDGHQLNIGIRKCFSLLSNILPKNWAYNRLDGTSVKEDMVKKHPMESGGSKEDCEYLSRTRKRYP